MGKCLFGFTVHSRNDNLIVKIIMAKMYIHNCKFLNIKPLFSALASEIKKKKKDSGYYCLQCKKKR